MSFESIAEAIRKLFGRKGEEIVEINLKAFHAGREYSLSSQILNKAFMKINPDDGRLLE